MKRVLVVDDEPSIRQLLQDILQEEGFGVLLASGGQSMLALLETEVPDLILLDVMMPYGNGEEAIQRLQEDPRLRDIPVIVMSAGLSRPQLNVEPMAFLGKPFDLRYLLQVIDDIIGPAAPSGPS